MLAKGNTAVPKGYHGCSRGVSQLFARVSRLFANGNTAVRPTAVLGQDPCAGGRDVKSCMVMLAVDAVFTVYQSYAAPYT